MNIKHNSKFCIILLCIVAISQLVGCKSPTVNVKASNNTSTAKPTVYKYDFGFDSKGAVADGFLPATPTAAYNSSKGYGLDPSSKTASKGDTKADVLNGDYLEGSSKITFYQDLPAGDYQIKVTHKSAIICESDPGKANVSVDGFNKANQASLTESTFNVAVVDGKLNLDFVPVTSTSTSSTTEKNGKNTTTSEDGSTTTTVVVENGKATTTITYNVIQVASMQITKLEERKAASTPALYIIGDSTGRNTAPLFGWGQKIDGFVKDKFTVQNKAMAGRSSKKYYNEGRLNDILTSMNPGDYVVIQMGHNDQGKTPADRWTPLELFEYLYKDYYIKGIKQRGGIPVILSTTTKYDYNKANNTFNKSAPVTYNDLAQKIANEESLKFIDVTNILLDYYNSLPADTRQATVYSYYSASLPSGGDTTHFDETGATKVAELIAPKLLELRK